jgi:hypothetical protein
MTVDEALRKIVTHPHYSRYAELCGPNSPSNWHREEYGKLVVAIAEGAAFPFRAPEIIPGNGAQVIARTGCCNH